MFKLSPCVSVTGKDIFFQLFQMFYPTPHPQISNPPKLLAKASPSTATWCRWFQPATQICAATLKTFKTVLSHKTLLHRILLSNIILPFFHSYQEKNSQPFIFQYTFQVLVTLASSSSSQPCSSCFPKGWRQKDTRPGKRY